MSKKKISTSKDIQIRFLASGASEIEAMLADGRISITSLKKAFDDLAELDVDVSSLAHLVPATRERGRPSPCIGESRTYSAQKLKDGSTFVRLPLEILGIEKSQKVRVTYDKNTIVISKV